MRATKKKNNLTQSSSYRSGEFTIRHQLRDSRAGVQERHRDGTKVGGIEGTF
jgi:hypothetical protein